MIYQDEIVCLIETAQEEYEDYKEEANSMENPNGLKVLTEEEYVRGILSSLNTDIREQARSVIENMDGAYWYYNNKGEEKGE